jgi:hypothetical protein
MSANIQGTRLDTWFVTLQVENPNSPGDYIHYEVWDTRTGGEIDSEERIYYPGGMAPSYSLGGRKTPGQLTLSRNYRLGRDHDGYQANPGIQQLIDAAGVSRVIISATPMDRYKKHHGRPIVWTGTLKTVTLPEHNSESTSDPGMITLVCTIDAPPTST